MTNNYYFGYGSNLHPKYMAYRLTNTKFVGVGKLYDHKLIFNKLGKDNSGKANIIKYEDYIVWDSVYLLSSKELSRLDTQEKGYRRVVVQVLLNSNIVSVYAYQALEAYIRDTEPFGWYKELVLSGAKKIGLNKNYIRNTQSVESQEDLLSKRELKYMDIIRDIKGFN